MRHAWFALAASLALGACAEPLEPATNAQVRAQCFWASQVTGFSDTGPDRALINIGARETWELTLSPGCPDVNWAMRLGIRAHGGERICTGRPAELLVPEIGGSSGMRRCLVREIRKLSPEEAAATRRSKTRP